MARRRRRPSLPVPLFALDQPLEAGATATAAIDVDGTPFDRVVVCTRWLGPDDDLGEVVAAATSSLLRPGDVIAVSEKLVLVTSGRAVPASSIRVTPLARWVAARVRPIGDSRGLSIPGKMQLVIDLSGRACIVLAVAAAAVTRPLGLRGAFYVVAGPNARAMDGLRKPYHDVLLPPLARADARALADELSARIGHPVAVVDINDRGGSVRAVADGPLTARQVAAALRDNPMGQRAQATPIVVIRRAGPAGAPQRG